MAKILKYFNVITRKLVRFWMSFIFQSFMNLPNFSVSKEINLVYESHVSVILKKNGLVFYTIDTAQLPHGTSVMFRLQDGKSCFIS